MILLTDKAKIDFEYYQVNRSLEITNSERQENSLISFDTLLKHKDSIWNLDKLYLIALIVDWFDSIDRINFQELYMNEFRDNYLMYPILSIQAETIKKANEIYNNKICLCCNGKGLVEGEEYDDVQSCLTCNGSGKLC